MNPTNLYLGIEALLRVMEGAARLQPLFAKARQEGRDFTPEELATVRASLDLHVRQLDELIQQAEAKGK